MIKPGHSFQAKQLALTAHIRNPQAHPCVPGIEERRLRVYRELLFNNICQFIDHAFPVLKSLYTDAEWIRLIRSFFVHHDCKTPFFSEIPKEFLDYLKHAYPAQPQDPPFLYELAHYEWIELALSIDTREVYSATLQRDLDILESIPVLSPLAWRVSYQWPVHAISQNMQPQTPSPTSHDYIVYRNHLDDVQFIVANSVTSRLFQLLDSNTVATGKQLLDQIASEINHPNPSLVLDAGKQVLLRFLHLDVISGMRKPCPTPG